MNLSRFAIDFEKSKGFAQSLQCDDSTADLPMSYWINTERSLYRSSTPKSALESHLEYPSGINTHKTTSRTTPLASGGPEARSPPCPLAIAVQLSQAEDVTDCQRVSESEFSPAAVPPKNLTFKLDVICSTGADLI